MRIRTTLIRTITATAVVAAAAAGCQPGLHGQQAPNGSQGSPAPQPAPQAQPVPQAAPAPAQHAGQPVLAVKIDNAPEARPAVGLGAADVVYVEPVEGGLSRLIAVFGDHRPPQIGPVRSARETDLELLGQYGRPTLAYSGAAPQLDPMLAGASVTPVKPEQNQGAFFRDESRESPHNLFTRPDRLPEGAPWSPKAEPNYGPAPAGGAPQPTARVAYESATTDFTWSPQEHRYQVSMDGQPANAADSGRLGAGTVVLQEVPIQQSAISDVAGSASPHAKTVGSGRAVVLRDGKAYAAKWNRPSPEAGTSYTTESGEPLPFAQGPVWVALTGRL